MTRPTSSKLFLALDATWPPLRFVNLPPWTLREGAGGGQRVSAATAAADLCKDDITAAEVGMRDLQQHPLFMLRPGDDALDEWLKARNYDIVDPVAIYLMPLKDRPHVVSDTTIKSTWPASAVVRALWEKGGIGPARVAVMDRVRNTKTVLVAKGATQCLGAAFVAKSDDIAMLHALEVAPDSQRRGIGTCLMHAAAQWANQTGAEWLALMVTRANSPANALYRTLGMCDVGQYHYRRAPQAK